MRDESVYASWDDFSVLFDADKRTFSVRYEKEKIIESLVIKDIEYKGENIGGLDTFGKYLCERVMVESGDKIYLVAEFSEGTTSLKRLKIKFMITSRCRFVHPWRLRGDRWSCRPLQGLAGAQ